MQFTIKNIKFYSRSCPLFFHLQALPVLRLKSLPSLLCIKHIATKSPPPTATAIPSVAPTIAPALSPLETLEVVCATGVVATNVEVPCAKDETNGVVRSVLVNDNHGDTQGVGVEKKAKDIVFMSTVVVVVVSLSINPDVVVSAVVLSCETGLVTSRAADEDAGSTMESGIVNKIFEADARESGEGVYGGDGKVGVTRTVGNRVERSIEGDESGSESTERWKKAGRPDPGARRRFWRDMFLGIWKWRLGSIKSHEQEERKGRWEIEDVRV
jgi:hypothetical protein